MQCASLILQASLGITIFIGTVLITGGQIELYPSWFIDVFYTNLWTDIIYPITAYQFVPSGNGYKADAYTADNTGNGGRRTGH